MSTPLRFRLESLLKDSNGKRRPVGIDSNSGNSLPVRLGYNNVWQSTFQKAPCRDQFHFAIEAGTSTYSVVGINVSGQSGEVVATRPPAIPNSFWLSTIRGEIPGSSPKQWAATYELLSDPNMVWTVANTTDPNPAIVLRQIKYTAPGTISDDQLFTLKLES